MSILDPGTAARSAHLPCLILVGGQGTRLRPVISDIPKPMARVNGRPFLEYLVRWVRAVGYTRVILCAGYRAAQIQDYFADGQKFNVDLTYSIEEQPLGTWGAIRQACEQLEDPAFLVLNGDSWLDADLNKLESVHKKQRSIATFALAEVKESSRFGCVEIDSTGRLVSFSEKGRCGSGLINGGVYIFSREVLALVPPHASSLESEVCPMLIPHGVYGLKMQGYFVDIGVPEEYKRLLDCPDPWLRALRLPAQKDIC